MKNGFVIKYPECIMDEVEDVLTLLNGNTNLKVIELHEITEEMDCDFLVIPGGSCDLAIKNKMLHKLINKVKNNSGLLAAICNGALVLASSGALKGEKCTHTAHPKYAPLPEFKELLSVAGKLFLGTEYVDEDVVISNNIITAKPHVAKKFAIAVKSYLHSNV